MTQENSSSSLRIGGVELDDIALIQEPHLEESTQFHEMSERLRDSEAIVEALRKRGEWPLDKLLTDALDSLVASSRLDVAHYFVDEAQVPTEVARCHGARDQVAEELTLLRNRLETGE